MRTIYCPGNLSFTEILNSPFVDKSMLIEMVNANIDTPDCFFCVSRPRRFGKTLAADMLTAYYDRSCDSEALFAPLKISKSPSFREHLNQYHVLRLDGTQYINLNTVSFSGEKLVSRVDLVQVMRASICEELLSEYPEAGTKTSGLLSILSNIVDATGVKFIVILDEWDAFLRKFPDNEDLKDAYLLFLRSLFKVPESGSLFAAVYMTGFLPIKRCMTESGLNNFTELTMFSPAATADLFGFTEEEVRQYLSGTNLSFEDVAGWYDGYRIQGMHIYNPYSIAEVRDRGQLGQYWSMPYDYAALREYLYMDFEGLFDDIGNLLKGIPVRFDPWYFTNDLSEIKTKDHLFTALVHLGYLTYDSSSEEALIPNREIYLMYRSILQENPCTELFKMIEQSDQVLKAILARNAARTAELIAQYHEARSSKTSSYNNGNVLKASIREALLTAVDPYILWDVFPAGKGGAGLLYLPKKDTITPAFLVELKRKRSPYSVIRQIKSHNYPACLQAYSGKLLLAGISYDPKSWEHKCTFETFDVS